MSNGFFNLEQVKSTEINNKTFLSCASCGLYKTCLSPKMKPFGKFKRKILWVGEAPGEIEDRRGKPWQGRMGQLLQRTVKKFGVDLFEDGIGLNSCACRPPKNRTPSAHELSCCRNNLVKQIKEYKPNLIFLIGACPINSIIGKNFNKKIGGVTKWRSWVIPDQEFNAWICPIFHPSFVSRKEEKNGQNLVEVIWQQDIENALSYIDKPVPKIQPEKYLHPIYSDKEFKRVFEELMESDLMSFDYEATGLKPHAPGHKIITVSACPTPTKSYSWMNTPYRAKLFARVLANQRVRKISHNLLYEDMWSNVIMKTPVLNWYWDTMVNNHIVDNRQGINGLKFLSHIYFGIGEYNEIIEPYLESPAKSGANAHNKLLEFIKKYGDKEVLKYCGLDSLFCFWLFIIQTQLLGFTDETIHLPSCPFPIAIN